MVTKKYDHEKYLSKRKRELGIFEDNSHIKEFDKLQPTDLLKMKTKELQVATYIKIKLMNGNIEKNTINIADLKSFNKWLVRGVLVFIGLTLLGLLVAYMFNVVIGG